MSMPLPKLKPEGAEALDSLLKKTVEKCEVPSTFYAATNAKETFYENQEGDVVFGDENSGKINRDTTLELFSMTKLVTAVSVLLLVERGLVSLDSFEDVAKHLPELGELPILKGFDGDEPILVKATNKITLRMLLTHTSGLAYLTGSADLTKYNNAQPKPIGNMVQPHASISSITLPLVFEPGTNWIYGVGIDWSGILVERISGLSLGDFFRQNIFDKVEGGMPDMTFYPTDAIKSRKMRMTTRVDGKITPLSGFGMSRAETIEEVGYHAGGAGLFGTVKDYLALLRAILASDPRHGAKNPLLKPESYTELFKGSITDNQPARESLAKIMAAGYFYDPTPVADIVDHSVGFTLYLADSNYGRRKGTGCWSGAARTQYWLDPTTGLAAILATQMLYPVNPDPWNKVYQEYETTLYKNLQV